MLINYSLSLNSQTYKLNFYKYKYMYLMFYWKLVNASIVNKINYNLSNNIYYTRKTRYNFIYNKQYSFNFIIIKSFTLLNFYIILLKYSNITNLIFIYLNLWLKFKFIFKLFQIIKLSSFSNRIKLIKY